jgi:hypothetical protein
MKSAADSPLAKTAVEGMSRDSPGVLARVGPTLDAATKV